jgi:hypothetical protein
MASASHAGHDAKVYPMKMEMVGFSIAFNCSMAIGAPLACQGLVALIGRDLLANTQVTYNGHLGQIILAV